MHSTAFFVKLTSRFFQCWKTIAEIARRYELLHSSVYSILRPVPVAANDKHDNITERMIDFGILPTSALPSAPSDLERLVFVAC